MALTQEQIDFYHKHGYLKYGPILTDEEVELYREEYEREMAIAIEQKTGRNLSSSDGGVATESEQQVYQIVNICDRNIHFRKLLYHEKILQIVADLMGPSIQLFHDQALYKPPHSGGAVFWHQDNGYWECRPASLMSCWITFDDVVRESGAMQVIPGSHLNPVWHEVGTRGGTLREIQGVDESQAEVIDLPAGGCMFHHCQTLHYTEPNVTDRKRRAHAIHFMPPGTRSVSEHHQNMDISFTRPLLRAGWNG